MKAIAVFCILLASVFIRPVRAQSRTSQPIEFGVDAGLGRTWVNQPRGNPTFSVWELDVPVQAIRVAFPLDDQFAIEPTLSLVTAGGDFGRATLLTLDAALLYELSTDRSRPQWFLRPFIGVHHDTPEATGITLGGGAGVKIPATDRIAARLEARYRYTSLGNGGSSNTLGLLAGVSVYTR